MIWWSETEPNHKSKHEKVFAAWFAKSMKKFDEGGKQAVWTSQRVMQTVYQTPAQKPQQTSLHPAQSLAQSIVSVYPQTFKG